MSRLLDGVFLILLGLIWSKLSLSQMGLTAVFWLAVYGAFANWAATLLAAIWGAGGTSMPIAATGYVGSSVQEAFIVFLLVSLSLAMLAVCVLVLWGLRTGAQRNEPVT